MEAKLIAIDIDGTLLNEKGLITDRTKKVIKDVQNNGIFVVLATGRHLLTSETIGRDLHLMDPIISHNGGTIYEPIGKNVVVEQGFNIDQVELVLSFLRRERIPFFVSTATHLIAEENLLTTDYCSEFNGVKLTLIRNVKKINEPILKLSILGEEKVIDQLNGIIKKLAPTLQIVRGGERGSDIMPLHFNKGRALKILCERYGVNLSQTIAFGNYYNDIEMIKYAGLGVAMGNAPKLVKLAADFVTSSNNEDGVANVLEELLCSGNEFYSFLPGEISSR
ncbi:Cof-type HAD-IIB family hydrolase [Evansella sp. AB-P1]|uniref:Cof-type HAD-IIB family hydrolase n=1 Tax=Evansella sp. AB-P1 TaxID=3037653 RepID=UPI00241E2399|nr:Cof-type HAD-IIB family hydrolase [Evansella sp. AB-P1]MDG5786738.1 Cof-type HAD-IIB family hydrolase [Evansella sp. AB-P1]